MGEYYYYSGGVCHLAAAKTIYHLAAAVIKYHTDLGTTRCGGPAPSRIASIYESVYIFIMKTFSLKLIRLPRHENAFIPTSRKRLHVNAYTLNAKKETI